MNLGKPKATAYNPLPQFSDSDSDIDIFNARSGNNNKAVKYRRYSCKRQWTKKILVLIFFILIGSLIAIYFTWYSKKFKLVQVKQYDFIKVKTNCGLVEGLKEQWGNEKKYEGYSFYSIPYAKPPIGKLRWKMPQALNESECSKKTLNKNKKFVKCFQGYNGYEDCLYLNVFTPALNESNLLPVFVYLHGGSFLEGSSVDADITPNVKFAQNFNVVAVSMNYRLNAFGFLTLKELWDENKSYGNYGIMDQILVLKWIRNNIKNFGGDPNSVVLFGNEAGGSSIFGLLLSPLVKHLFHKAVIINGDPIINESIEDLSQTFNVILSSLPCKQMQTRKDCLYSLDSYSIWNPSIHSVVTMFRQPVDIPLYNHYKSLLATDKIVIPFSPFDSTSTVPNKKSTKIPLLIASSAQVLNTKKIFSNNKKGYKEYISHIEAKLKSYPQNYDINKITQLYPMNFTLSTVQNNYEKFLADFLNVCRNNRFLNQYMYSTSYTPFRVILDSLSINSNEILASLFKFNKNHEKKTDVPNFSNSFSKLVKEFIDSPKNFDAKKTMLLENDGSVTSQSSSYHSEACNYLNQVMFEET